MNVDLPYLGMLRECLRAEQMENVEDKTFWAELQEHPGEVFIANDRLSETPHHSDPNSCFEAAAEEVPPLVCGFKFWAVGLAVFLGLLSAGLAAHGPEEVRSAVTSTSGTSREVQTSCL